MSENGHSLLKLYEKGTVFLFGYVFNDVNTCSKMLNITVYT